MTLPLILFAAGGLLLAVSRGLSPRGQQWLSPVAVTLLLTAAWDLACHLSGTKIFPSPRDTWAAFGDLAKSQRLWGDIVASLFRVTWGFMLAVGVGIPLGLFVGWSTRAFRALNPIIQGLRPISPIALKMCRYEYQGGYVELAKANFQRFFPETMKEAPRKLSPWELHAIGDLSQGSRKLSYSWIEAIASQKYRDDSMGSWPHLPPPFHTEVSSLAANLLILDEFGDERDFELQQMQREQFPDWFPDLDE